MHNHCNNLPTHSITCHSFADPLDHGSGHQARYRFALAFASNSHGRKAVSVETSISHIVSLKKGDVIFAEVDEVSLKEKIAVYNILIKKEEGEVVALFKGTVYRTSKDWDV